MNFHMKSVISALVVTFLTSFSWADQTALTEALVAAGASSRAIVLLEDKLHEVNYKKRFAAIADYTLASEVPRFFLIDLQTSEFKVYNVTHGIGSGGRFAVRFSNERGQARSSLGFIKTDDIYRGQFGRSLHLIGLSKSNSYHLGSRLIVLHGAAYSSQKFFEQNSFWGRSYGCLALPYEHIQDVITALGSGSIILAYHDQLWDQTLSNPQNQIIPGTKPSDFIKGTEWEHRENRTGKI